MCFTVLYCDVLYSNSDVWCGMVNSNDAVWCTMVMAVWCILIFILLNNGSGMMPSDAGVVFSDVGLVYKNDADVVYSTKSVVYSSRRVVYSAVVYVVQQLLESRATPSSQTVADLQSLTRALLDSLNDKNLALLHQRRLNK